MSGGWRAGLRQRALQGVPSALQVTDLQHAQGMLGALPGAQRLEGALCFGVAAPSCEQVRRHGLAWLQQVRQVQQVRQPRGDCTGNTPCYLPWRSGAAALAEIGVRQAPAGWPWAAQVFACRDTHAARWLLLLPGRAQLWVGWQV